MKLFHRILAYHIFLNALVVAKASASGSNAFCRETLQDPNVKQIKWSYLKGCLLMVNGEMMSQNVSGNIWRLMKLVLLIAFDAIDNIPPVAYKYMGYSLTAIPLEELRNISMENVDVVEIFGSIRSAMISHEYLEGFNAEQLNVIAQKVRAEWLGKNPQTYSEYDLRVMGEILCYLNVSDIENIHTDAFKEAAEWIGLIEKCPQDRLQALANLARRPDAFGEPRKWSKLEVSIIGNILNGLPSNEINAIAKDKLQLNHFYKPKPQSTNKTRHNATSSPKTPSEFKPSTRTADDMANKTQSFELS